MDFAWDRSTCELKARRTVTTDTVMMPCGTTHSAYALLYAPYPGPPSRPAVVASRVVTQYAAWLASTSSTSHPAARSGRVSPLPRQSKRGRQRKRRDK